MGETTSVTDFSGCNGNWVLILLFAMIFGWGNGGFGGNGNAATQADIQRAVDLNSLQNGQSNLGSELQRGIYEINNNTNHQAYDNLSEIRDVQSAIATGNANIVNNLTAMQANQQSCCCSTQRSIDSAKYDIVTNSTANTQKILDAITGNRMADMQNQISQLQLQNAMAGVVRYPMMTAYTNGANPFCGCSNM